jgi:cysteine desulfurase/selenocysteine lyase
MQLTEHLIAGLDATQDEVVTPRDTRSRSGIVTFSLGDARENVKMMKRLQQKRILVAVRYTSNVGGVRVSCHFYNSFEDVDRLLAEVKAAL